MTRARRSIWIPSLFVGMAIAIAVATSAGVLLYDSQGLLRELRGAMNLRQGESVLAVLHADSQGLLRAAAVLLGVSAVSLAAGLWMGVADQDEEAVPSAARGWVGFLVALLMGAGFTALWEAMDGFEGAAAAQGLGLAMTAALPAYFAGGVWGRLGGFAGAQGTGVRRQVVVGGLMGAGAGGSLALTLVGRPVLAVTAFLGATVLASAGARCQGWIFDRVPRRRLVLREPGRPELRFDVWRTEVPEMVVRVLLDAGRDRAVDPPPEGDWRRGVASTLDAGAPVLFVGAGSWFPIDDHREWRVHEPDPGVLALAAKGFGWDEGSLAGSPVPEAPGYTVVADWGALGDSLPARELLATLAEAGVERVWIRGPRERLPATLLGSGLKAGFGVSRYLAVVAGAAGPPRVAPRGDEVCCFQRSPEPLGPVSGMKELPVDSESAGGGDG